ncbi:hypothetical protein [Acidihalobacter prosperus]|nr:hypothetical protein [Acidihalobacter prosperus]
MNFITPILFKFLNINYALIPLNGTIESLEEASRVLAFFVAGVRG